MTLVDWDSVTKVQDANAAYNRFLKFFSGLCDIAFPEQKVKIKNKTLNSPWMSKGLQSSSKRKYIYTKIF